MGFVACAYGGLQRVIEDSPSRVPDDQDDSAEEDFIGDQTPSAVDWQIHHSIDSGALITSSFFDPKPCVSPDALELLSNLLQQWLDSLSHDTPSLAAL